MNYQWFQNGSPIYGATSSTYTILTVLGSSKGTYWVKVSNAGGSVISSTATLNLNQPPSITTQPQSQQVAQGQSVSFSVAVSGSGPFKYQWSFNTSLLAGASTEVLTLSNVQPSQAGNYTVVVTDAAGSATSTAATLMVLLPAAIAMQPQSQSAMLGQDASFSVVASGTAPLGYQWNFNGSPLPGATASALALTNVRTSQAGSYTVVVTSSAGSVTSVVATLTVTIPTVTLSLSGSVGTDPKGFAFQVSAPAGLTYIILASSDLQTWTPIATNLATTGSAVFTDPTAANHRHRFYRAMLQ